MKNTEIKKQETSEERIARFTREDIKKMKDNEKTSKPFVLTLEEELSFVRSTRNEMLVRSDWTQLPDVPKEIQDLWRDYRRTLRDLTKDFKDLQSITWPKLPG